MPQYLVDTNVLLRAASKTAGQHSGVVHAISRLIERGEELFITPQILIEFWSVATRPADVNGFGWSAELVRGEIHRLLDQFPLLPDTPAVFEEWLRLVSSRGVTGKQVHDARLVAVMNTHRVGHLLTFNIGDFKGYDVTIISPDEITSPR
jgi:predicted nucleic acid-binding protein